MEMAAGGRIGRRRQIAFQLDDLPRLGRVHSGDRRQQGFGVRMLGIPQDFVDRPVLDDAAQIHHGHFVSQKLHDPEVVRDEKVGQPEAVLEIL